MKHITKIAGVALTAVGCVALLFGFNYTTDAEQISTDDVADVDSEADSKLKLEKTLSAVSIVNEPDFMQEEEAISADSKADSKLKLEKTLSVVSEYSEQN